MRDLLAGHPVDDVRVGALGIAEVPLDVRRRRVRRRGGEADRIAVEGTGAAAGGTVRVRRPDGALVADGDGVGGLQLVDVAEAEGGDDEIGAAAALHHGAVVELAK